MIRIIWSPINQAFLILWNESVLSIKSTRSEAEGWIAAHNLEIG